MVVKQSTSLKLFTSYPIIPKPLTSYPFSTEYSHHKSFYSAQIIPFLVSHHALPSNDSSSHYTHASWVFYINTPPSYTLYSTPKVSIAFCYPHITPHSPEVPHILCPHPPSRIWVTLKWEYCLLSGNYLPQTLYPWPLECFALLYILGSQMSRSFWPVVLVILISNSLIQSPSLQLCKVHSVNLGISKC